MRALVIYCHPRPDSYTAAVRDEVLNALDGKGVETRLIDLYRSGFDPVMSPEEHASYEDESCNQKGFEADIADLKWCDTLIFVYPTWWYGLPAMLKGWLDRVFVPGVAFSMPDGVNKNIRPGLQNIRNICVFTTCGASRWLTFFVGAPGRKTILRGLRLMCAKACRTLFVAHYAMDSSTPETRKDHLDRVARQLNRFVPAPPKPQRVKA